MDLALDAAQGILAETWKILNESSPFILLGFTVAALIKTFIPDSLVARHLGRDGPSSVIKAALFGVPIPLCSCGVVPAALGLRKQGASRGATVSFLISTPETGVDSIAITYALLDPLMTIFRPIAAFVTAVAAGLLENLTSRDPAPKPEPTVAGSACDKGCCHAESQHGEAGSLRKRLQESFRYTFGDLLADIGKWLLIGIVLAGIISYLVPAEFLQEHLGQGFLPMLIMLLVGLPLYVCATSSTPIAAALVLKGLSPGAALVFLLVGPATNVATMTVVGQLLGKKSLVVYLATTAGFALLFGYALDLIYGALGHTIIPRIAGAGPEHSGWLEISLSALLIILVGRSLWLERYENDG